MSKSNVVLTIPEPGKFELVEKPFPKIKPGYAVIKTEVAPVCLEGTRIWTKHGFETFHGGYQSDYPDGLGHEGVGVGEPEGARRAADLAAGPADRRGRPGAAGPGVWSAPRPGGDLQPAASGRNGAAVRRSQVSGKAVPISRSRQQGIRTGVP